MLKVHTTGLIYISDESSRVHTIKHPFNIKPSAVSLYIGGELVLSEVICDNDTVTVRTNEDVILEVICSFPIGAKPALHFHEFVKSDLIQHTASVQQTLDMGIDITAELEMVEQQEYKCYISQMVESCSNII